jgi:hypothetical protein
VNTSRASRLIAGEILHKRSSGNEDGQEQFIFNILLISACFRVTTLRCGLKEEDSCKRVFLSDAGRKFFMEIKGFAKFA